MSQIDPISAALRAAAVHLANIEARRRKALTGRLILKPEGILIEITTAAGFGADRIVAWEVIATAVEPSKRIEAVINATIEEAVNPKPV